MRKIAAPQPFLVASQVVKPKEIFPWQRFSNFEMFEVREGESMGTCEVCGNEYDKAFQVVLGGDTHTFDSFECAINMLAPTCDHCGCRVIGHGVESKSGVIFCCANCAKLGGVAQVRDRAS